MNASQKTSRYSRYLNPLVRPFPDFDVPFIAPLRRKAIARLELEKGDRVLDVGCGAGGSFRYLLDAVGPQGEVVGIEISPATAALARRRIQKNGWRNVKVIEGPAETVGVDGKFDGVIMFGANEIFTSKEALDNVFARLKPNARVLAMGAKLVERGWRAVLNAPFRLITSKLMLPATPRLNATPFALLEARMRGVQSEQFGGGFLCLIWGRAC